MITVKPTHPSHETSPLGLVARQDHRFWSTSGGLSYPSPLNAKYIMVYDNRYWPNLDIVAESMLIVSWLTGSTL